MTVDSVLKSVSSQKKVFFCEHKYLHLREHVVQ